jgi:hypothetical protein
VFQMDVAKVDRDVTYVAIAMVVHVCCKHLFPMFYCFRTYIVSVFIRMLYMFHTYVASVLFRCCVCLQWFSNVFQVFFVSISEACFKCF